MRGLLEAAAILLAPALAGASSVEFQDAIPSAYIRLQPVFEADQADTRELTFRLDVNESREACGYANITINGETLPQGGRGTLALDQGTTVIANWDFKCVDWNGKSQEQLMKLNFEYVDGSKVAQDTGVTIRFQQVAPVWISDIEGPGASMTRVHKAKVGVPTEDGFTQEDMEGELEQELAELEMLRYHMVELEQMIYEKEKALGEAFGWSDSKNGGGRIRDCDSLKCVAKSLYHKISSAAMAFYDEVAVYEDFFDGPGGRHGGPGRHHRRPHWRRPHGGHGGCGNHTQHGNHSHHHHGNHTHGNHTLPPPPWSRPHHPPHWRRPPFHHPPPFCHCPPPPHHPPPHHPPPHHAPGRRPPPGDGPHHPHHPPHHGPGNEPGKRPPPPGHGGDGEEPPHGEWPPHHRGPWFQVDDTPEDSDGHRPPMDGERPEHPEHPFPPPPPEDRHPGEPPRRGPPHDGPPRHGHEGGPHRGPPPHDGPHHGPGGPPGRHHGPPPPPPFHHRIPPPVKIGASAILLFVLVGMLHKRCCSRDRKAKRAVRREACRRRRCAGGRRACRGRGFLSRLFFGLRNRYDQEEEEKSMLLESEHEAEEHKEESVQEGQGELTVAQEIASFRTAADLIGDMVAAEEGRAAAPVQQQQQPYRLHPALNVPIITPVTGYLVIDEEEELPAYKPAEESEGSDSVVADGFSNYTPSSTASVVSGGGADDVLGDTKH
ncbi:hypothetical protein QBC46DRAFT_341352 [Diplogelasinospora grovesii]|uniref:Uncharacterized protein n=1 Tax=Diplogelasinospora grovesii TaxID=303347 RepID=A0AAN6N7N3_9PEZI|nr:hypothetical protein QBC46DRAFT_341352 [Diplogelasinospora grovesii]